MTVSVLVPYGSSCDWRRRAWDYVRAHYETNHAGWELIVGRCDGPWSKGEAVANAFYRSTGDVLVLADADSFVDAEILAAAVDYTATHNWIVPHLRVRRLNRTATRRVLDGGDPHPHHLDRAAYAGLPGGGITVLRRSAYCRVGGIDRRFLGWGGEDISFAWALETLVEPAQRLLGDLWHLWHPYAAPKRRGTPASEALAARYRDARGDQAAMQALIDERTADATSHACHDPSSGDQDHPGQQHRC